MTSDLFKDGRFSEQLALEDREHRLDRGIIEAVAYGADRRGGPDFINAVGVGHRRILTGFNRSKQHRLVGPTVVVHINGFGRCFPVEGLAGSAV